MKKSFTLVTLFLLLCSSALMAKNDYDAFPKYKEVVSYFFKIYSYDNCTENSKTKFEKHPDGWHIYIRIEDEDYPQTKGGLLWDLSTKSFKDLPFIKKKQLENNDEGRDKFIDAANAPDYDVCPYFGYVGWDSDVIKAYNNLNGLGDTLLYGVGKAYGSYASNLLNNNSGFSDSLVRYKLKPGKNSLSSEQLQNYRKHKHKAIEAYKMVNASDPNFETFIGSISLKLSHEYLSAFLELRLYQNEEEAQKELPENAYNDFYISLGKNYLSTCDKNAIIFVNGDVDTYPLLYVQAKYNFRPDVMVVNTSLLQDERYINHFREKILEAPPLKFSISADKFDNKQREFIILYNDASKVRDLSKSIKFAMDEKHKVTIKKDSYFYFEGPLLKTKVDGKSVIWQLPFNGYFTRNALMMLDIISNYNASRPIYFAITLAENAFLGLDNYMRYEGLAYKLSGIKLGEEGDGKTYVNTDALANNLLQEYVWKGNNEIKKLDRVTVTNYANQFYYLGIRYINQEEPQKAKEALDTYFKMFPDSVSAYGYYVLSLMDCYYRLKENDKANEIGKTILLNMKNRKINVPSIYKKFSEKEYNDATLAAIKKLSVNYGQNNFYKDYWD